MVCANLHRPAISEDGTPRDPQETERATEEETCRNPSLSHVPRVAPDLEASKRQKPQVGSGPLGRSRGSNHTMNYAGNLSVAVPSRKGRRK